MKGNRFIIHSEGINKIRDEIINVVYLASGFFGIFSYYGSIMRTFQQGYSPYIIFYSFLFVATWSIYFLRKQIPTNWKTWVFFTLFFLMGTFLNMENGIVSGALHFVFVSTIVTLLYGWRLGVISIIATVITRSIIAILYYKGILIIERDLNSHIISPPILISILLGALFIGAVMVFAINKFYNWLLNTLDSVTDKVSELEKMNRELEVARMKAIENDRLKTVFLANMSHEVRTPMNAIIGFAGLLGKPELDETKRLRFSSLVKENGHDLLRLIEDILDISKIEIGQLKIVESETELNKLLQEINEFYSLKVKESGKDVKFKLNIDSSAENREILTDKQRLKQVIVNLIENSFKFTKQGIIEVGCKIDKEIHFYVKDTGIGIPQHKQKIIFDRFRQADDSVTARKYGGTGLGLSICKGILELMGGDISLQSSESQGATFNFSIPLKEVKEHKEVSKVKPDIKVNFEGKSLLIVEDDKACAEYLRETLTGTNINIFHSSTYAESVETLDREPSIELMLLDVRLPDVNGLELARKLRRDNSNMKIIAQTAYASSEDIKDCINAGCDDFISKPIDSNHLLRLIDEYL